MIDNGRYGLRAKAPLSNPFMAILVTAHRVFAVVEMNRLQARKAKHAVKLAEHVIKLPDHVIACVVHMAGIQTNAEFVAVARGIDNLTKLFKAAPDLAALARHRFQQNRRSYLIRHHRIEQIRNIAHADFDTLFHMAARMKIQHGRRDIRKALQILPHGANGKLTDRRIRRACVQRIGRMRENRRKAMLRKKGVQRVRILPIKRLDTAATRIAREKLECVRADGKRLLAHRAVSL